MSPNKGRIWTLADLENAVNARKAEKSTMPAAYIPKSKFSQSDSNKLTAAVVEFLNYQPDTYAWRVNNGAIFDPKIQTHRTTNTVRGIADISACVRGQMWQIEIKVGKDRQSEDQKRFAERVEKAGGRYFLVRSFDEFTQIFHSENSPKKWAK